MIKKRSCFQYISQKSDDKRHINEEPFAKVRLSLL